MAGMFNKRQTDQGDASGARVKRAKPVQIETAFEKLIFQAGCRSWSKGGHGAYVVDEPGNFRRVLGQKLLLNTQLRKDFVDGLEEHLQESSESLYQALLPVGTTSPGAVSCGDSFTRLLLGVAPIQSEVARLLLEKLPLVSDENVDPDKPIQRLLLGQLRWLDQVVEPHLLTAKVLEVMPVCPEQLQKEIISFLPEFVTEDEHEVVVEELRKTAESDSTFIVPVLEAVSNMSLEPELQALMVEFMLDCMPLAEVEDLPALVKFLVQGATISNAREVIDKLREQFYFVTPRDPRLPDVDRKEKGKALVAEALELPLLTAFKTSLPHALPVCEMWVKVIRSTPVMEPLKTLDFWVLLIIHAEGGMQRKAISAILRKKFADDCALHSWMTKALRGHKNTLKSLLGEVLLIAQAFVHHGTTDSLRQAGRLLYIELFCTFSEAAQRQELLLALHNHLGTQSVQEAAIALDVLMHLSQAHTTELLACAAFLTGIMDYLETFADDQLYQVFRVFSNLVVCASVGAAGGQASSSQTQLEDDLYMLINKQVSSADAKYKRIGIIGTIVLAERLGATASCDTESETSIASRCERAEELLKNTLDRCKATPPALAFLCDELANVIQNGSLGTNVVEALRGALLPMLQKDTLCDLSKDHKVQMSGQANVPTELWLSLDGNIGEVAVPILPRLASADASDRDALLYLCPFVRLVMIMEVQRYGNLQSVAGVLGCPLVMLPRAVPAAIPAEQREIAGLALFHAINWVREQINGFSILWAKPGHNMDATLQGKLFARLYNVCELEAELEQVLAQTTAPISFPCLLRFLDSSPTSCNLPQNKPKKQQKKPKNKGSKGDAGLHEANDNETSVSGKTQASGGSDTVASTSNSTCRLSAYRSHLRALHLPAVSLLSLQPPESTASQRLPITIFLLCELQHIQSHELAKKWPNPFWQKAPVHSNAGLTPLTVAAVLEQLRIVMPAIRACIDVAQDMIKDPEQGHQALDTADQMFITQDSNVQPTLGTALGTAFRCPHRVIGLAIGCINQFLSSPQLLHPAHRADLCSCLQTLAAERDLADGSYTLNGRTAPSTVDLVNHCLAACEILQELSLGAEGLFDNELAFVRGMKHLLAIAEHLHTEAGVEDGQMLTTLKGKLSTAAGAMLEEEWEAPAGITGPSLNGWKGRGAALTELLKIHISSSNEPVETIRALTGTALTECEAPTKGKSMQTFVEGWPSLAPGTFIIWYRTLFEELLAAWGKVCAGAMMGDFMKDAEKMSELIKDTSACAAALSALVMLTKQHAARNQVLSHAVKSGGKFVELFSKVMPYWQLAVQTAPRELTAILKDTQAATRILQAICSDVKARLDVTLTAKVPAVKRSLERFVMKAVAMLNEAGEEPIVGILKHKDMLGNVVPSQAYVAASDAEKEEEEEEDEVYSQHEEKAEIA